MNNNPYAPPTAKVADTADREAAPPLWNPSAAANWSLLFSPVFGALLHMKNWQALGEPAKAATARVWVIVTLCAILALAAASVIQPGNKNFDGMSRLMGLVLLLSWYFGSGKSQVKLIKERFGTDYPRRGWGKPLLFGLLGFVGFLVLIVAVGVVAAMMQRSA